MSLISAPSCMSLGTSIGRCFNCEAPQNANNHSGRHGYANPLIHVVSSAQGGHDWYAPMFDRPVHGLDVPDFGFETCICHLLPAGCYYFYSGCCYIRARDVAGYKGITSFVSLLAIELQQLDKSQISVMYVLVHLQCKIVMLSQRARMLLEMDKD